MKQTFNIEVKKDSIPMVPFRCWKWSIYDKNSERDRYGYFGTELDSGGAFTAASANRKAKRAARRIAAGKGGGRTYEYKTSGEKPSDRDDLLETIARLEEELGL